MMARAILAALGLLGVIALLLAPITQAQSFPCTDTNVCDGEAYARVNSAAGHRRFCFTTDADTGCGPSAQPGDEWEMDAGDCLTAYYRTSGTGTLPPDPADDVILRLLYEDSSTIVATYHDGAPPSNDEDYEVCATTDGTSSGDPRAGTYRLFIQASVGGVGAYTINSDGTGGDEAMSGPGALRGRMFVSTIAASTPPAGSIFAYGPTGDEEVDLTITHTEPFGNDGHEEARIQAFQTVSVAVGADQDVTGSTTEQSFTIDDTFNAGATNYEVGMDIVGNSPLHGGPWTIYADSGHGLGLTRFNDTFLFTNNLFTADPRITTPPGTCEEAVYNRGETGTCTFRVLNARDEGVSKEVQFLIRDSQSTLVTTQFLTGDPKVTNYTIQAGDDANATASGAMWTSQVDPVDTYPAPSREIYSVSSLYYCDVHPQTTTPLVKDDFPNENQNENETYFLGADNIHIWGHVAGVRLDGTEIQTTGDAVTIQLIRPNTDVYVSYDLDTGVDGWTDTIDESPVPPAGAWTLDMAVSSSGNSCSEQQDVQFVSSFTANLVLRLLFNHTVEAGEEVSIFVRSEVDDEPTVPGGVPVLKISRINYTTNPVSWEDVVSLTSMVNVDNYTPTVSGTLYQYNFTPTEPGTYNVWVRAPLNSAPIRESSNLLTAQAAIMNISIEELATLLPLFWVLVVWIVVWRMHEAGPRYTGLLLGAILGFIESILPEPNNELRITALAVMTLGIVAIAIIDRFGTRNEE